MQSKWRAPACYVGVGVLCALYLSIVPGVSFTDVCAGAGLGAAVMWAINEWETGKWNVPMPVQPALAALIPQPVPSLAVAGADIAPIAAVALQAAPPETVAAAPVTQPATPPAVASFVAEVEAAVQQTVPEPTPRHRVDSGAPTPDKMEKWEIDEKEPSWDATALAETWAKLRAELSINRPGSRPAVSPDLPRGAQYARNADPKADPRTQRPQAASYGRPQGSPPAAPASGKFQTSKSAAAKPMVSNTPGAKPLGAKPIATKLPPVAAQPTSKPQPAGYKLGSLGQNGGSPVLATLASGGKTGRAPEKAAEPARQIGSFLRSGAFRPR